MQQVKGSWAKITAVTAMLCFLLGAGYALASQFLHQTGYYFEWNGQHERVARSEVSPYRAAFQGALPFDPKKFFGKSNTFRK
jgi:hypothetical protein